ncbi:hypothetical protein VTK26DRAFT_823 [Humicola hyalothermophila]
MVCRSGLLSHGEAHIGPESRCLSPESPEAQRALPHTGRPVLVDTMLRPSCVGAAPWHNRHGRSDAWKGYG